MTNNQSPDEINPYDVLTCAYQAGFMVSEEYGTGKAHMPVSDCETLLDFHRAMLAASRADLIKPEPVADLDSKQRIKAALDDMPLFDEHEIISWRWFNKHGKTIRALLERELIKPVDLEALRESIYKALDKRPYQSVLHGDEKGHISDAIDYLAAQGRLRPAVPREVIDALDRLHINADYNGCLRDFRTVAAALDPYMEKRE
jgi:hypothetical protein